MESYPSSRRISDFRKKYPALKKKISHEWHVAWRTLLVYTAKNLTSFGSYELIKTQIASIFGKKLKFINSSPFNIFFSGCKTKIELKCEKYGPKWDHFLTARVTFTVQPRILWDFSVSVNGTLETFLHRGQ